MTIMTRSGATTWLGKELPPHVAYLYKNDRGDWQEVTWQEIHDKRCARQKHSLSYKRRGVITKPCWIWVFKNESWIMGGWWIYIRTNKNQYGISFWHEYSRAMIEKSMSLYPLGIIPSEDFFIIWAEKFAATYPHVGFHRTDNQGIAPARCIIDEKYDRIIDIMPTQ